MPRGKKMWLLALNLSAEANAREEEELFKVKDNVGIGTNECNLAMNKFRLKIRKWFVLSEEWVPSFLIGTQETQFLFSLIC